MPIFLATVEPHLTDTPQGDTCNITENSESPERISIDFNTLETPEERTLRYSV